MMDHAGSAAVDAGDRDLTKFAIGFAPDRSLEEPPDRAGIRRQPGPGARSTFLTRQPVIRELLKAAGSILSVGIQLFGKLALADGLLKLLVTKARRLGAQGSEELWAWALAKVKKAQGWVNNCRSVFPRTNVVEEVVDRDRVDVRQHQDDVVVAGG